MMKNIIFKIIAYLMTIVISLMGVFIAYIYTEDEIIVFVYSVIGYSSISIIFTMLFYMRRFLKQRNCFHCLCVIFELCNLIISLIEGFMWPIWIINFFIDKILCRNTENEIMSDNTDSSLSDDEDNIFNHVNKLTDEEEENILMKIKNVINKK